MPGRKKRNERTKTLRQIKRENARRFTTSGSNHGRLSFWAIDAWKDDLTGEKERDKKRAIGWLPPKST
jgi:hypothetical protein